MGRMTLYPAILLAQVSIAIHPIPICVAVWKWIIALFVKRTKCLRVLSVDGLQLCCLKQFA